MAEAVAGLGHWDQAVTLASEHLHAARAFGAQRILGAALRTMAVVTRDLDERVKLLTQSLEVLDGSPARLDTAGALIDLGSLMSGRDDLEGARTLLEEGFALATACKASRLVKVAEAHLSSLGARSVSDGDVGVAFVYS